MPQTIDFSNPNLYVKRINELTEAYYDPNIRYIFIKWWAWAWKSVAVAQLLIQNLDQYKILCIRKVYETIKESMHSEFVNLINQRHLKNYWWDYVDRPPEIRFISENKTIYKWIQHEKDREKLKSVQWIDQCWVEEATEITADDFEQIKLRVRSGKNNKIILTFNPIDVNHRLKKKVEDDRGSRKSNSVWIEKTAYDNNFLPLTYISDLEKMKLKNPNFYKIYVLNQRWQSKKWVIFTNYTYFDYDIEPDIIWLDFGYNDPTALTYIRIEDKSEKRDLYIRERLYKSKLSPDEIIKELKVLNIPTNVLIVADNARPELIQEIKNAWYNIIPANKGAWSVVAWINLMNNFNLHIRGKNIVKEFQNYCWKLDKNWEPTDTPIDDFNHLIDSARYAILYKFANKKQKAYIMDW